MFVGAVDVQGSLCTQERRENDLLYRAQDAAKQVFNTYSFPRYSDHYIRSQEGIKGTFLSCYSKVCAGVDLLSSALEPIVRAICSLAKGIFQGADHLIGFAVRPLIDFIYPINPINGERHFALVPRSVEKVIGDWLFYPLATLGKKETNELLPSTNEPISSRVSAVFERIHGANEELLNPKGESTQFNYRITTLHSSDLNAFAVPGGGMVVFSQMVKEIQGSIVGGKIKQADISFADGSFATVDLRDVVLEDVLGALIGHEMTHVASRHSMGALIGKAFFSLALSVVKWILIAYLTLTDRRYREIVDISTSNDEKKNKEDEKIGYGSLNKILSFVQEKIEQLFELLGSRKNEYEADVTGIYFAKKAHLNPLGAIYLEELLQRNEGAIWNVFHKHCEFFFTHPYGENRKRAAFAAIQEMCPEIINKKTTWKMAGHPYDLEKSSPAVRYPHLHKN